MHGAASARSALVGGMGSRGDSEGLVGRWWREGRALPLPQLLAPSGADLARCEIGFWLPARRDHRATACIATVRVLLTASIGCAQEIPPKRATRMLQPPPA